MINYLLKKLAHYFKTYYITLAIITLSVIIVFIFMLLSGILRMKDEYSIKRIYFADNISASHKILIDKFNKLHVGKIEVVPIDLPFEKFSTNERKELLIRSLRNKSDRIDLFSVDQIWVPRFAKWTEPMNKYFTTKQRSEILNQIIETCYYNDTLVAVPLYFDIGVLYCNERLLDKLPDREEIKGELRKSITWEKFLKLGERMKKGSSPFFLFPADKYEGLMCTFAEMLASQNEKLFAADTVNLNSKAVRKSVQLLIDLVNRYKLSPKEILSYREAETYKDFINRNGAFMRGWPGLYEWYKENIKRGDASSFIKKYPLPHFEGGKPVSILGGWNLMVSKYSANKPETFEFIKFLLSEESQKTLYLSGGYLPVKKSIYADSLFMKKNSELKFYKDLLSSAVQRPFVDKYTRYSDIIAYYINEAMGNKMSADEALFKAQKIINSGDLFIR